MLNIFLDPASNRREKEFFPRFKKFELKFAENRFEEILSALDNNNSVGIGFANRQESGNFPANVCYIAFPSLIFSSIISISL